MFLKLVGLLSDPRFPGTVASAPRMPSATITVPTTVLFYQPWNKNSLSVLV